MLCGICMLSYSFAIICIASVSVVLYLHVFFIVLQYFVFQVLVLCYVSVMLQELVLSFKSCVASSYKHARIMYEIKSKPHNWQIFLSFG